MAIVRTKVAEVIQRHAIHPFVLLSAMLMMVAACASSEGGATPSLHAEDAAATSEAVPTTTTLSVANTTKSPAIQVNVERGLVYREATLDDSVRQRSRVDVYVPNTPDGRPAVVLLHGYSDFDSTSERTPLTALADEIAQLGATVFHFKWHTVSGWSAESGDDLACMGSFVAARAADFGAHSDRVVIVGHSMGAEAGINLAFRSFDLPTNGDCTETSSQPTARAFLGIGGSYGGIGTPIASDPESYLVTGGCNSEPREVAASDLITPGLTAQQGFDLGSYSAMDLAPADLRVVLLVGTLDPNRCTRPDVTRSFAEALETNGIDAQLVEVEGAGHEDVIWPDTDPGKNTISIIESILADLEDA